MSENLATQPFAHLRLHTEFSITDGLVTIPPLMSRLQKLQMPAAAITDLVNLFGLIKFYSNAVKAGIKPICGCDMIIEDDSGICTNLVLLVKDREGYLNLTHLISDLYTDSSNHSEPVLSISKLVGRTEGLIALSGAQQSNIAVALLAEEGGRARHLLGRWQDLFPERFYLEIQRVGKIGEQGYIDAVVALALETQCPVVATNNVRFIDQGDFDAHEVRVCINERRALDDPRRPHNYTDQQYLKSSGEMNKLFADIPEAIQNAWEIVKRCNLSLELGKPHLPNYPIPENVALEDYLSTLSSNGLKQRLEVMFGNLTQSSLKIKPYLDRLKMELKIINQMGFAGYFLIVMEFIQWAKDNGIPVGPGRGSGAGSIVAYALGITDLDPLKYDLLFERFLNPERVSMPDFDVDFCMEGRDRVIQHVAELYGKDAVSQIITFGTMAAKAVVRDVARVQGKPYALADKLSKMIPFEPGITLKKALDLQPLLKEFIDSDEDVQEIMEMAYKLEGITRNVGRHAGGVVIAPTKLTDFTPLYCDEPGHGLVTQFDKTDVETAGLVKFDFLGLRTLTIIDWAVKMINAQLDKGAPPVNISSLPLDDEEVYRLLQRGETVAVFQLESRGMKDLIKRLVPNCFEDIIALVALFRPGPLQSGMVDDFIDRKHGRTHVVYDHDELKPVLSNTYGVILYQEQVMKIAQVLADYTLGGADILRKAMGKKAPDEMAKQRVTFLKGAESRDIDVKTAEKIFNLMEKFAGYGFNKSHSAAYALVSYQTAWLKAHYPAYFMAAVLTAEMQNTDKIVTLIDECQDMGLTIIPPDINQGEFNFVVNGRGEIVYGLGAIKGLGEGPVENILKARVEGPFNELLEFCLRVDIHSVNKRTMEALIRSGALDGLVEGDIDYSRAFLSATLAEAMQAADQRTRNHASGVDDLFGNITPREMINGNPHQSGFRLRAWTEQQRLIAEKETLGLYLSGHPIREHLTELKHITTARLANVRPERGTQLVAGLLHDFRTMRSRKGDTIAFLILDDCSGRFEVSLLAREYERYRDLIQKDEILLAECTVTVDDYNGSTKGRAKQLMTLSEVRRRFAYRLALNLNAAVLQVNFCKHLATILEPYRQVEMNTDQETITVTGDKGLITNGTGEASDKREGCQIVINYERAGYTGCIMLGQDWLVLPTDDLIQKLKVEYGKDRVALEYRRGMTLN